MKCISLWQPWATLWLLSNPDEKVFETRDWGTSVHGALLVHAAKKKDGEVKVFLGSSGVLQALDRHGLTVHDLAFGAIIGRINLVDCRRMPYLPEPSDRERSFGNWSPERFAWMRGPSPILFKEPIPWCGSQGFFDVPTAVVQHELQPVSSGRLRCPTCDSPAAHLHPAMQFEGEVQPCHDPWHEKQGAANDR